ncbi:MAG: UPF0271 protein [Cyclobacteriaceae bacterium]|jgi:UPF0271 protein
MVDFHLNCDFGEFDSLEFDLNNETLIDYVHAINLTCGAHAGNPSVIAACIKEALYKGIEIGAHPSFPDRPNFGRNVMYLSLEDLSAHMRYQIGALFSMAMTEGTKLSHVKPHGALYNLSATDIDICRVVYESVQKIDDRLPVYGLAGSVHQVVAKELNMLFISEGFADRRYVTAHELVSRSDPGGILQLASDSVQQVKEMLLGRVMTEKEGYQPIEVKTICIHSDHANAMLLAKELNRTFN